jgi:hypothetical protein
MAKPAPAKPASQKPAVSKAVAPQPTRMKRSRWKLLLRPAALALLAGLFVAVMTFIDRRPDYLCKQWEAEARRADAAHVPTVIAKLDRYGRYGLPALVRLLAGENEAASTAARDVLLARLHRSPSGVQADDELLSIIANDLGRIAAAQSNDRVSVAMVDVALALMEATGRLGVDGGLAAETRERLLAACDEVLRREPAAPVLATILHRSIAASTTIADHSVTPTTTAAAADATTSLDSTDEAAAPESSAALLSAAKARSSHSPNVRAIERRSPDGSPRSAANEAARIPTTADESDGDGVRPASLSMTTASPSAVNAGAAAAGSRAPQADVDLSGDLSKCDAWSLFAALDDDRAGAELRRRGFTPRELQIGKALCSDDVVERRRYARLLPALSGVDVRPWLRHLAADDDEEVRCIAATIMGTTNDPALLAQLREMALDDPSADVRDIASRPNGRERK